MNRILYRHIKPEGWLRRQLEIQAAGLSGNLDKIWPDVRDSAWIGGGREGWERVPYWLDGFIPLAHLLEDQDMIARADKYIQCIVDRQQEDGWICPCAEEERSTYDLWAVLLIGKVLALHCEFVDDQRVENALYRTMKNLHDLMAAGKVHLFEWGKFRWFEGLIPLLHLASRRREGWMLELGRMLREQGADYPSFTELWKRPLNLWRQETHIVNLCMMLKYEVLCCALFGVRDTHRAEELWRILETCNGTAVGTFTGDECLSGLGNQQGTELCSVVELMYTCEWLYAVTGENIWAERLERIAFNALPATFTDDMWAHQYDQMVNQVACITFPGKSFFRTNGADSHLFGLEPNYGCCTANMHQGWPKLALHAVQQTDDGLVCAHLLPCSVQTHVKGRPVALRIEGDYPFRLSATITVETNEPVYFALKLRIPDWAWGVTLNGQSVNDIHGHHVLEQVWHGKTVIQLDMKAMPRVITRPSRLRTVAYGPLVFALPIRTEYRKIEYTKDGVKRTYPYCDYELIPHSAWNYGFASSEFVPEERPIDPIPFSSENPPLVLHTQLAPVRWDWADGYDTVPTAKPVNNQPIGESEEKVLIPYGCAKLRMTEMPRVSQKRDRRRTSHDE